MPANTARLALPYPLPDDTVDVPRDVQALAAKLDALTSVVPRVTALPASPVEGQEVAFVASSGGSTALWHLRYMADLGKWAFLGGMPWAFLVGSRELPGTGNIWVDLPTPGPSFTFPLAGDYDVEAFALADGVPGVGLAWGVGMKYGPRPSTRGTPRLSTSELRAAPSYSSPSVTATSRRWRPGRSARCST
jgi:hypothetical protein